MFWNCPKISWKDLGADGKIPEISWKDFMGGRKDSKYPEKGLGGVDSRKIDQDL